jgi:hypothetical protein
MLCPVTSPSGSCFGKQSSVLKSILDPEINFVLWQRNLSSFIEPWACEIRWDKAEELESELDLEAIDEFEEDLYQELKKWRTNEPDMTRWVASDICLNIKNFMTMTKAREVFVRIEPVANDKCRLFHVDKNLLRMLCTYVGEGTLWLPNNKAERKYLGCGENKDIVLDPLSVYQAPRLDVLILKGESWPYNLVGGAIHRSPPLLEGDKRLLLKVDFIS